MCTHCWGLGKRAVFHASTFDAEVVNAAVVLVWCHLVIDRLLITRNAVEVCFPLNHLTRQFVYKIIRKTNSVYKSYISFIIIILQTRTKTKRKASTVEERLYSRRKTTYSVSLIWCSSTPQISKTIELRSCNYQKLSSNFVIIETIKKTHIFIQFLVFCLVLWINKNFHIYSDLKKVWFLYNNNFYAASIHLKFTLNFCPKVIFFISKCLLHKWCI